MGITIVNGKKLDNDSCVRLDQGLNFGRGLFETMDVIGPVPVFLKRHLERMNKGLAALGIGNSVGEDQINGWIDKFNIGDCVLKILVTAENIILSTRENAYSKGLYKDGFKACISSLKRNPHSHVVYHKTLNYTDNILEKEKAAQAGFDEVVFTNIHDHLAEGSVSNLFFAKNNKIFTPAVHCGLLDGIVRRWVIDNFAVEEGEYTLDQLMDADEVFLTNSLMGIMPVRQLHNTAFNAMGKGCLEIQRSYREEIDREITRSKAKI